MQNRWRWRLANGREEAYVAEFQLTVAAIGWLAAPFVGAARTGAAGVGGVVVKLQTVDQEPIDVALTAFARQ